MKDLINQIDKKIEEYTKSIIADTVSLVNMNSEQGKPMANAPFGEGPRNVLDAVLEMAKKKDFMQRIMVLTNVFRWTA